MMLDLGPGRRSHGRHTLQAPLLPPPPPASTAAGTPSSATCPSPSSQEGPTRSGGQLLGPIKCSLPSLANSNLLFFSSAGFNAQVTVQENEPEEWLINRFRREVIRAGVFRECKKRRFFENSQDKKKRAGFISKKKKKRKARQAARRNKNKNNYPQRSSQSRYRNQFKQQKPEKDNEPKRKEDSDNDDNWDFYEVDLPYN
uniref:uncharacterized protein LOC105353526 n=1 Tax=Fragaria vesca subsp. vesca TaxID=101020 RepID=UPI0005CB2912|nr:PREDICTED: uncharacterized protein LOC105353526 [Fragaria vesca subsp. vesca]